MLFVTFLLSQLSAGCKILKALQLMKISVDLLLELAQAVSRNRMQQRKLTRKQCGQIVYLHDKGLHILHSVIVNPELRIPWTVMQHLVSSISECYGLVGLLLPLNNFQVSEAFGDKKMESKGEIKMVCENKTKACMSQHISCTLWNSQNVFFFCWRLTDTWNHIPFLF